MTLCSLQHEQQNIRRHIHRKVFKQHVPLYQLCKYLFPLNSYKISLRRSALSFRKCRLFHVFLAFFAPRAPYDDESRDQSGELLASFVFSSISSSPSTVTCLSGSVGVGHQCLLVACGSFCARFFWIFEEVQALKHFICIFSVRCIRAVPVLTQQCQITTIRPDHRIRWWHSRHSYGQIQVSGYFCMCFCAMLRIYLFLEMNCWQHFLVFHLVLIWF